MCTKKPQDSVTAITDAFFDDICAFIYMIGVSKKCTLVPNGLGYSISDTAKKVSQGLVHWAEKRKVKMRTTYVTETFYDSSSNRNNPFRSIIDLNFANNLADYLGLREGKESILESFNLTKTIWVLGPFSDLARLINNRKDCYSIWCSGSSLINIDNYVFPEVINIGRGSNAGIDPLATLSVWSSSTLPAKLISRQPPIMDVYNAIKNIRTFAGRKISKTLNFSIQNNPGGGFVWDLGCALTQQHPDIIIQEKLYNATLSLDPAFAIQLTIATESNPDIPQVFVVNISIDKMLEHLVRDISY